jgi:hypothetical protein
VVSGGVLALLAAASGGPLGNGRLAAVGPSAWQVGIVSTLEIGVAAAVTAGARNYLRMRRVGPLRTQARSAPATPARGRARPPSDGLTEPGHVIFVDPWAGDRGRGSRPHHRGPSALP